MLTLILSVTQCWKSEKNPLLFKVWLALTYFILKRKFWPLSHESHFRCVDPVWKQTMVYPHIKLEDFKRKYLEISVWSFSIYSPHVFLGQVVIDLSGTVLECFFCCSLIKKSDTLISWQPLQTFSLPCRSARLSWRRSTVVPFRWTQ